MRSFRRFYLFTGLFGAALLGSIGLDAATLVDNGSARGQIVIPAESSETLAKAAEELREHILAITGAEIPVVVSGSESSQGVSLVLASGSKALQEKLKEFSQDHSAFGISVRGNRIDVVGTTDDAVLYGVYELLEQLGVRWYMPGELGRVLPVTQTILWKEGETWQQPSFTYRVLQDLSTGPWRERVRLGGEHRATGAHGIQPFIGTSGNRLYESNPEYYALYNGNRIKRQVCVGNPKVLELAIQYYRGCSKRIQTSR